jgi:hypothetical protein
LPLEYTVLGHNADSTKQETTNTLTWNIQGGKNVTIYVDFLPFQFVEKTMYVVSGVLDVTTVFPTRGIHEFSSNVAISTPVQVNDWKLLPELYYVIPSPIYGNNIKEEYIDVFDKYGSYNKSLVPIDFTKESKRGWYYITPEKFVVVCPNYGEGGNVYQYNMTTKFCYSTDASEEYFDNSPYSMFYRFGAMTFNSSFVNFQFDHVMIKCVLPENTDPQPYIRNLPDGDITVVDGKPIVTFSLAPITFDTETLQFDITDLRDFYYYWEIASILILIGLLILANVVLFLKPDIRRRFKLPEPSFGVGILVANITKFASLSQSAGFALSSQFRLLLTLQGILVGLVIFVPIFVEKHLKKKQKEKEMAIGLVD